MKTYPRSCSPASLLALTLVSAVALLGGVASAATTFTWTQLVGGTNGSGTWSAATNWNGGAGPIADGADNTADFGTLDIAALSTVTLDGARTIGNLKFGDTTPSTNWVLSTGTSGPLTLAVSAGLPTITTVSGSNTVTASLAGTAGLLKNGSGLLRLNVSNSFAGNVVVDAGTLQLGNINAFGPAPGGSPNVVYSTNAGTLEVLNGIGITNQQLVLSGAGFGGTNGALYANVGTSHNQNTRWSFALNNFATPAIVLAGDTTIRIDGDALQSAILVGAITNTTPTNAFTLTKTGGAELRIDPGVPIACGNIHVVEGIFGINGNSGNSVTDGRTITVEPAAVLGCRRNVSVNSTTCALALNGKLELNYNPGATSISSANAFSQRFGTLSGNGVVINSMAMSPQELRVQSTTSDSAFNGTFVTPYSTNGAILLRKEGSGTTLRLLAPSTYFGTNTVNGGTLMVDAAVTLTNNGCYVVNTGGILGGTGLITAPIILNSGSILAAGDPAGTLTVSNLVPSGGETIIVSNATLKVNGQLGSSSLYAGTMYLTNGTLQLPLLFGGASAFVSALTVDGPSTIAYTTPNPAKGQFPLIACSSVGGLAGFAGLTLVPPPGTTAYLSNNTAAGSIDVVVTALPALVWTGAANGNWDIGLTTNWLNGATPVAYTEAAGSGPYVWFDDTATGPTTVNVTTTLSPQGITVTNTAKNYTLTGSGVLNGGGGILKQGPGTLTLANTGPNTFSGTIAINAGVVQVGNNGSTGDLGAATVNNNAELLLNRSDSFTLANPITGAGSVVKQGAGMATLSGIGNLNGPVGISNGILAFAPAISATLSGDVSGAGTLAMSGAGTLVLDSFNNTYAGGTVISSGTLQVGDGMNPGSLPAGAVTDNGTLALATANTYPNNISGIGGLSVIAGASATLSGLNTYVGPTAVKDSTLFLDSASALAPATTLVLGDQNGGTGIGTVYLNSGNPVLSGLLVGGNQASSSAVNFSGIAQKLTVNGNFIVGNTPIGAQVYLTVSGPDSTLAVVTNGGTLQVGLGNTSSGVNPDNVAVDLTGLGNFYTDLGTTGTVSLGTLDGNPGPPAGATVGTVLKLAALSNSVSAGAIVVGAGGRQLSPELRLSPGTNRINCDTLNLGTGGRDGGKLLFDTGTGGLTLRGYAGGASRANLNEGVNATTGTSGPLPVTAVDLTGGYADLLLATLTIGDEPSRVGNWTNNFAFDQGVLDALAVVLGNRCRPGTIGVNTMDLGGGVIRFGPLTLTASTAAGTLNITNGSVTVNGSITDTGAGISTLNLSDAALSVTGAVGTATGRIDALNLTNATFNLGIVNGGYGNPISAPVQVTALAAAGPVILGLSGTGFLTGQFPLISYTGSLGGDGFAAFTALNTPAGVSAFLSNNVANASVDVVITSAPPAINPNPTNILFTVSGGSLNLSWPLDHKGWLLQTNAVSLTATSQWFTYPGSAGLTTVAIPIDPTKTNLFFRLLHP